MNIQGEKVRVRDKVEGDSANESIWGLDGEILALDPPVGKLFNIIRFSIETLEGVHIGYCSLYNQNEHEVQLGIRIGDKNYWGKGYGTEAVNILVGYWLNTTDTSRLWLKVLPQNIRAIRCYDKVGFVHVGRLAIGGYEFLIMERRRQ